MARAVQTAIDSLNFFVESRNVGNIFTVISTATLGGVSPDQINTQQKGAMFFITLASISVNTATLGIAINAKDVSANAYFPYARVSLDGLAVGASLQYIAMLYVGSSSTAVGSGTGIAVAPAGNTQILPMPVPAVFQITSTLTITTTASQSGSISYSLDYEKIM
jgi:hypothetical protein